MADKSKKTFGQFAAKGFEAYKASQKRAGESMKNMDQPAVKPAAAPTKKSFKRKPS